jgi:hypothetical protein
MRVVLRARERPADPPGPRGVNFEPGHDGSMSGMMDASLSGMMDGSVSGMAQSGMMSGMSGEMSPMVRVDGMMEASS